MEHYETMTNTSQNPKTQNAKTAIQVGVISDTHGLLRPEAIEALAGSSLILHAGDIGKSAVLEALEAIAPVIAVRGNNDKGEWAATIPEQQTIEIGNVSVHLLHIVQELSLDPKATGIQVVISGHSHKPKIEEREGVLFLNPGSAGPRRFKLPISVAHLFVDAEATRAEIIPLEL